MIKLKIDDTVCDIVPGEIENIGEAITQVMGTIHPSRIVTKLNINGNRYPSNNTESTLSESIDSSHEIEIRTADKAIWAATGYDIAISSIQHIQKSVIKCSELFRENDKLNGNRLFVQCIEGLERFIEAISITKAALNLDFVKIQSHGITLAQLESELNTILKSVFVVQQAEDYQGLADKIEYELVTNLSSWAETLKVLRNNQNSNA